MAEQLGFGHESVVTRLGRLPRSHSWATVLLIGIPVWSTALAGCAEEKVASHETPSAGTTAGMQGSVPPKAMVAPAVPNLPPPPAAVLSAQMAVATLPQGIVRTEDGRILCESDGAELVLVPEGEFVMGATPGDAAAPDDESPAHRVFVSAFFADRHEVTNGQFAKFVSATGYRTDAEKEGKGYALVGDSWNTDAAGADWQHPQGPGSSVAGMEAHPVVLVSWNDAKAFCDWAGRRLPTEAEFEKALRGGTAGTIYPWGNTDTPTGKPGNYADEALKRKHASFSYALAGYDDGYERTSPAGSFAQNGFGLFDVSGNAWEWCADWYDAEYYGTLAGGAARDPQGPSTGTLRMLRGGNWFYRPIGLRCAYRSRVAPDLRLPNFGFRCARGLP